MPHPSSTSANCSGRCRATAGSCRPQAMSNKKNIAAARDGKWGGAGSGGPTRTSSDRMAPYRWSVPAAEPRRIGPRDHPSAATRTKLAVIWQAGDTVDSSTGGLIFQKAPKMRAGRLRRSAQSLIPKLCETLSPFGVEVTTVIAKFAPQLVGVGARKNSQGVVDDAALRGAHALALVAAAYRGLRDIDGAPTPASRIVLYTEKNFCL